MRTRNGENFEAPLPSLAAHMLDYRLFFYDGANRITKSHEFEAQNDDEAIQTAEAWREGRKMDLWNRARRVHCWGF